MLKLNRYLTTGVTGSGQRRIVEQGRLDSPGPAAIRAFASEERANYASMLQGLPSGTSVGGVETPGLMEDFLSGFVPEDDKVLRRLYRQMYYSDSVIGPGIDMLSTFPFSKFHLAGISDVKRLEKFASSVDMLDVATLFPSLSIDYLIFGQFVSSLNWNPGKKIYDALIPFNLDFLTFQSVPIYGVDPAVTVQLPPDLIRVIQGRGKDVPQALKDNINRIPSDLLQGMTSKRGVTLDPEHLVYIARPGPVGDTINNSILKRLLPVWLMEKALARGTLDQVWKRQRGILHAQVGEEDWVPNAGDYQQIQEMILAADHDPTGAVMVTRSGINISEIRRGDDFWRWDMIADQAQRTKLIGLGLTEAFITGDATIADMEGAVNVTLAHFEAYRNMLTKAIFYDKIFPTIAIQNNFKRRNDDYRTVTSRAAEIAAYREMDLAAFMCSRESEAWHEGIKYDPFTREVTAEFAASSPSVYNTDLSQYTIPRVVWSSTLDSDTREGAVEKLQALEQIGIPIPLRTYAAAAGQDPQELLNERDADLKFAKLFMEWRKARAKFLPDPTGMNGSGGDSDSGGSSLFASADGPYGDLVYKYATGENNGLGEPSVTKVGVLNREYDPDLWGVKRTTHRGTPGPVSREGARVIEERITQRSAEALVAVTERKRHEEAERAKVERDANGVVTYSYHKNPLSRHSRK